MKKIWKTVLIVLSIFCLSIIAFGVTKKIESQYTIDTPYEYPIVPGTQEWIELEDVVARRKVCQIPDDVLNHITTDALLETVINYPFRSDMYSFNDFQTGYEAVKNRFNGLQELERRSDCLDALLRYSQVSYSSNDDEAEWEHYIADSLYYAISGEQILQDD